MCLRFFGRLVGLFLWQTVVVVVVVVDFVEDDCECVGDRDDNDTENDVIYLQ